MPKETFFNLPEDKRANITQIAIEEFANNDYADVSISRIVARAGIAKGSFYQYFEDKEDLHAYLLELAVQKKWELLSLDHPDPDDIGVFRYLHWTAQAGVKYQLIYPELVQVAFRAFTRNTLPKGFYARALQDAHKFYVQLVAKGKEQGDIAPEIDSDLAAFIFAAVLTALSQYIMPHLAGNEEYTQGRIEFFDVPEAARIFDEVIDILEYGMGRRPPVDAQADANENIAKEQEVTI